MAKFAQGNSKTKVKGQNPSKTSKKGGGTANSKSKLKKQKKATSTQQPEFRLRWDMVNKEALTHFRNILKIDTTNPPGNELKCAQYLKQVFDKEGIPNKLIKTDKDRGCIVAYYKSKSVTKPPLILTSHMDVVPHEPDKWDLPAFAAKIKDGYLYGRGTVDMKNMTAMALMTMLLFKRQNIQLDREIIFVAVADEEVGSKYGMEYLVTKRPEVFKDAEYALNEIGAFTLHQEGRRFYPIQTAEKGFIWIKVELEGTPGHGSMPHAENPVVHLSEMIAKMYSKKRKVKIDQSANLFIKEISKQIPFPKSQIMRLLKNKIFGNFVMFNVIPEDRRPFLNAILHDTISPNMLSAGSKENVIPGRAEVVLDCRVMPGTDMDRFVRELKQELESYTKLKLKFTILQKAEAATWSFDTPLYDHLKSKIEAADPGSTAIPALVSGFTDSKFLARLGVTCYGFTPIKIGPELNFAQMYHGHNERIPVDGFHWGLQLFYDTVRSFTEVG